MNMDVITIILIVYSFILLGKLVSSIDSYLKNKTESNRLSIDMDTMIKLKIEIVTNSLDTIIKETFDEYMMLNILHKNVKYIHDEMQKQIIYEVASSVTSKISKNLLYQLSLFYSEDKITDMIGNKIYFIVNSFCISFNAPK